MNTNDPQLIMQMRLPQHPFLFVDKVLDYECNNFIVACKHVTTSEPFLQDHLPQVMSSAFILEALTQTCSMLIYLTNPEETRYFFLASMGKCYFSRLVRIGDCLTLNCELKKRPDANSFVFSVMAEVGDTTVCGGELKTTGESRERTLKKEPNQRGAPTRKSRRESSKNKTGRGGGRNGD